MSYSSLEVDRWSGIPVNVFDGEGLCARLDSDMDLVVTIVGIFKDHCPVMKEAIVRAIEARDCKSLSSAAHALKGSAANISAVSIEKLAHAFESLAKSADFTKSAGLVEELELAMAIFKD